MTIDNLAAAMEVSEDRIGDRRPRHPQGGQHRMPQGIKTIESLSDPELREDHRRRLEEFEAELQREIDREFGGVDVPF